MAAQFTRMKGRGRAGAGQVDLFGKKLLADAALSQEENRRVGLRRLAGNLQPFLDDPALPDEGMPALVRADLVLKNATARCAPSGRAGVLHGDGRLRGEDFQPLQVILS